MSDELKDNYSSYSTDNILPQKKRNLEITQTNIIYIRDSNPKKRNSDILKEKIWEIIENNKKYKTLDPEEEFINNNNNINTKKKIEKKVNRNLKILNIVKEKMLKENIKNNFKEEYKNINSDEIKKLEEEQKIKDDNKLTDEKIIEKNNKEKKNIEEEKKNKLLNIINSKKYNRFQRIDNEKKQKESSENIINSEIKLNKRISSNENNDENKVQVTYTENNILNKNEFSEISSEKKILISHNKRTKTSSSINDIKYDKNNNSNSKVNWDNTSSKKGALKILELLKIQKKEQNGKIRSNTQHKQMRNEPNENNHRNQNIIRNIEPYNFNLRKKEGEKSRRDRNLEIVNSLPKKNFKNEEDETDNKYDFYNKTPEQFRDYKKINNNKKKNNLNYNDNNIVVNKTKKFSNINIKSQRPIIINNNNNILNNSQNYPKIERVIFNNPITIRNKYRQKLNNLNISNNKLNSINSSNKHINSNYENYESQKNVKTIEKRLDIKKQGKKHLFKRSLKSNILMNRSVYRPKKVFNNSPKKLNEFERNSINAESAVNGLRNNLNSKNNNISNYIKNSNFIKKISTAYVKKSPGKFDDYNSDSFYNNTIDNSNNNEKSIFYSKKPKKIINYIDKNDFNNIKNIRPEKPNNIYAIDFNSINGFNTSIETISSNKVDTIKSNYNDYYNNKSHINNSNINKIKNINSNRPQKRQSNSAIIFNLEDLMVLEERLNEISLALESGENIENKCFNFWNYFYNSSLYNLIEKIFKNKEDSNIVRLSINYELISIMVCYEYSFEINLSEQEVLLLLKLMDLNHDNLIIISEYILTKIVPENKQNIWVLKIQEIIEKSKLKGYNQLFSRNYFHTSIERINFNTNSILNNLKNILLNFPIEYSDILITLLKKIDTKTYEEINDFFREYILRVQNYDGSIIASSYLKKNKKFNSLPAPYLTSPPSKPYTLVLDLDETLVYFKIKSIKGGTMRARPYLFGFLEEMGHYYELVIWTSATEAYANSLIDAVEYEKKYFDYVLYREHAIIIGNDFVKDLTRLGRGLDRIIIIDDMPQNFRLQKENGITIKPFFGDDLDDSALYNLVPILKHIAESRNDVRIGLKKYREEIIKKVTSNISKNYIRNI